MTNITKFCALKPDPREYFYQPFRDPAGIVATNGHILVVVPDDGGDYPATHEKMTGKATDLRDKYKGGGEWFKLAEILLPETEPCRHCDGAGHLWAVKCDECNGAGEFRYGSHWYECKECEGKGRCTYFYNKADTTKETCSDCQGTGIAYQPVRVGNSQFQHHYLHMLASLPDCEISPDGESNAAALRFTGGDGILMPCLGR